MTSLLAKRTAHPERAWDVAETSDEELLGRYLAATEPDSQEAFRTLVVRHGPMVLGVCRHVLNQDHDAEDAFQATFLVLARQAGAIRDRRVLSGWLHEVAYRIALRQRTSTARRRVLERQGMAMLPPETEPDDQGERAAWNELRPVLHEELDRLPAKYRIPVILSYLEGKTNEEVAALLEWPVGTVKGRLSRAREMLRSRLSRRGLALSAAFLITSLNRGRVFAEIVPNELVQETVRFALTPPPLPGHPGAGPSDAPFEDKLLPGGGPAPISVRGWTRTSRGGLMLALFFGLTLSVAIGSSMAVMVGGWGAFGAGPGPGSRDARAGAASRDSRSRLDSTTAGLPTSGGIAPAHCHSDDVR